MIMLKHLNQNNHRPLDTHVAYSQVVTTAKKMQICLQVCTHLG